MSSTITPTRTLPADHDRATLIGRVWLPGPAGGPSPVVLRGQDLVDLSGLAPTVSDLLELDDPVAAVRGAAHRPVGTLAEALSGVGDADRLHLLAPCDLQPIKAAGVTFAASMLERVIEERARGDAAKATAVRRQVVDIVGDDLSKVRPGSSQAMRLKEVLVEQGMWSQYLEVGIGPDAEIFTKAAPMSAVGTGSDVGLHPGSTWNNPEPEIVLVVDSRGEVLGATLGNDVNLRDFEGRSALLLGKAKDNNGACAIGPFIRLFDEHYGIDDVRSEDVTLEVAGVDGFELRGVSSMRAISRDPLELAAQAIGPNHQYPDGLLLFCGTMFAPVQDRDVPGNGFTHKLGDLVTIGSGRLGSLVNRVNRSDRMSPWTFGISALMRSLARRGLLAGRQPSTH
jgi:fumarylacetoacetate (FAA) hydrolase family protein